MLDVVGVTPHPEHLIGAHPHQLEARRRVDDSEPGPRRVQHVPLLRFVAPGESEVFARPHISVGIHDHPLIARFLRGLGQAGHEVANEGTGIGSQPFLPFTVHFRAGHGQLNSGNPRDQAQLAGPAIYDRVLQRVGRARCDSSCAVRHRVGQPAHDRDVVPFVNDEVLVSGKAGDRVARHPVLRQPNDGDGRTLETRAPPLFIRGGRQLQSPDHVRGLRMSNRRDPLRQPKRGDQPRFQVELRAASPRRAVQCHESPVAPQDDGPEGAKLARPLARPAEGTDEPPRCVVDADLLGRPVGNGQMPGSRAQHIPHAKEGVHFARAGPGQIEDRLLLDPPCVTRTPQGRDRFDDRDPEAVARRARGDGGRFATGNRRGQGQDRRRRPPLHLGVHPDV